MLNKSLYSQKYNVEFFHITKNAMTAIIRDMGMAWYGRDTLPSDRKIFCVTRDPLNRTLSGFNEIKKLYAMGVREHTFRTLPKDIENKIFNNGDLKESFELYITELENKGFFDNHNQLQYDFLEGYTVKSLFDVPRKIDDIQYFLKFESINEELSNLLGQNFNLNRVNSGNQNVKNYLKPILETYKDRIYNLYKKDYAIIENYG